MQNCKTGMKKSPKYLLLTLFSTVAFALGARAVTSDTTIVVPGKTWKDMLQKADSLRLDYSFQEASVWYDMALRAAPDSSSRMAVEENRLKGQNAINMTGFCSNPAVVARRRFPVKDYFLFYPLKDKSWRPVPNQLDSIAGSPFSTAVYVPSDARELYFSSHDDTGVSNLYHTTLADTVWTAPELINEEITSTSNEIFPMVSADGKTLYFASEGLYGMGGYDLYTSKWNEETGDWDVPVNMGFPYSSPYDDFLFMNTSDGKYSIFASNRGCPADSVNVYVVEFDGMPVRKAITDREGLVGLSALSPDGDPSRLDSGSAVSSPLPDNPEAKEYMRKMEQVRLLRDSIAAYNRALEAEREAYSKALDSEKEEILTDIAQKEAALPALNASLGRTVADLQQIEMDFLMKGVVIDPSRVKADAEKEVVGASSGYAFTRKTMGPALNIRVQKPKPTFDYTFMVLPEGRFAEDNTLPAGLVYQIQLFSSAGKATVKQLRGLSPVFEKASGSRYTYSAGVFRSYKDVLANLNKVKRQGFRNAFIVAYNDGKSVSVQQARNLEKTLRPVYWLKVYPTDGQALPSLALSAIQQQGAKDIMRGVEGGSVVFTCGPFAKKEDADALRVSLRAVGVSHVEIEEKISD